MHSRMVAVVVSFATRAPLPAQRSVRLCRLTCIEQCVRALEISNSLRCPVAVAGHAGPPALPPPDRPFHTMYLLPCAEVDTCGALSNALAQRAVHAHASDCVRAIFASYVISTCAQGKTHACRREVALPWGHLLYRASFSPCSPCSTPHACVREVALPWGHLLFHASFSPCSPCSTHVLPPCARARARVHIVASESIPSTPNLASGCTYVLFACLQLLHATPWCVFGHFLLHVHHFCERILHCNHSTRGRTTHAIHAQQLGISRCAMCVCVCERERPRVHFSRVSSTGEAPLSNDGKWLLTTLGR